MDTIHFQPLWVVEKRAHRGRTVRGMAFLKERPGRAGIYVYYHDRASGRLKQLARKLTKHLDGKPMEEVQAWLEAWERKHGLARDRSERMNLAPGDKLQALWDQYQTHRKSTRKRRDGTAEEETAIFERQILPYFVGKHERKDPARWHDLVPDFHAFLFAQKYRDRTIQKTLWLLERFGKHLVFARYMSFPFAVQVPARENHKVTPLKARLLPEQVIGFASEKLALSSAPGRRGKKAKKRGRAFLIQPEDLKLAALLGYFAALRPSELFALSKADFLTGQYAASECRTFAGLQGIGLGSKLGVAITKTLSDAKGAEAQELTKTDASRATVNIWDPRAALMIAELVKARPDGRLFPLGYSGMTQAWKRHAMPKLCVTLHDLRRASGLYLGREKRIPVTLLQEHMRHAEIETTMLYMRNPSIAEKRKRMIQDFDSVI